MKTDLRYIKGATYGVAAPNSWYKKGISLCEFCAAHDFCQTRLEEPARVFTGCEDAIMPLTFLDRTGLHHKNFSTIRLGKAWNARLEATRGYIALIHKTKTKQHFLGFAEVTWHECLAREMALVKSSENHLLIDRGGSAIDRLKYLKKTIRRYYGGFDQKGTKPYTVIGLRRLDYDESKRLEAAWPMGV